MPKAALVDAEAGTDGLITRPRVGRDARTPVESLSLDGRSPSPVGFDLFGIPFPSDDSESRPSLSSDSGDLDESPRFLRFDTPSPVSLETRGLTSQSPTAIQGQFWESRLLFKSTVAIRLAEAGAITLANELLACHSQRTSAVCRSCAKVSHFYNRCDRFYCPACQPRLARERSESVEWWTKLITQPKHVVLTLRNTDSITKAQVQGLKASFSRLRRMKVAAPWAGGFYSLEVTNRGNGWHLHLHAIIDVRFLPQQELAAAWHKATRGAGSIVYVKDARRTEYLREVTKYAAKGSDLATWSGHQLVEFIGAMKGVRTFGVFGSLYAKRTEWRAWLDSLQEHDHCCPCGSVDFILLSDLELSANESIYGDPRGSKAPVCAPPQIVPPQHAFSL